MSSSNIKPATHNNDTFSRENKEILMMVENQNFSMQNLQKVVVMFYLCNKHICFLVCTITGIR